MDPGLEFHQMVEELWNSLSVRGADEHHSLQSPSTLIVQIRVGSGCPSWPVASVSPRSLTQISPRYPGTQKRSSGLKQQVEYRATVSRALPNSGELLKLSLGQRAWQEPQFMLTFHLESMDGSKVWAS